MSPEEQKERRIMELLLKIKNGTPPMRKSALRRITDKAREFGAGPLFNQVYQLIGMSCCLFLKQKIIWFILFYSQIQILLLLEYKSHCIRRHARLFIRNLYVLQDMSELLNINISLSIQYQLFRLSFYQYQYQYQLF